MADRRAGALTVPCPVVELADSSIEPASPRPPRPAMLELAAAILIIGGLTSVKVLWAPLRHRAWLSRTSAVVR